MWTLTAWVEFLNGSSDSMYITYSGSFAICREKLTKTATILAHDPKVESFNFEIRREV